MLEYWEVDKTHIDVWGRLFMYLRCVLQPIIICLFFKNCTNQKKGWLFKNCMHLERSLCFTACISGSNNYWQKRQCGILIERVMMLHSFFKAKISYSGKIYWTMSNQYVISYLHTLLKRFNLSWGAASQHKIRRHKAYLNRSSTNNKL